jgi:hypothetical protein
MRADVVQAVEQVFRGSSGPVLDVDQFPVQGTLDGLLNITNLDLGPKVVHLRVRGHVEDPENLRLRRLNMT